MTSSDKKADSDLKTVRDTIESIWIAIVLAFVLRAFVIEAFVIPTGSMAPRLMGEHFDLQCPACGYNFAFGLMTGTAQLPGETKKTRQMMGAHCPNCGFDQFDNEKKFVSGGDRVLVLKYLYQFQPPKRWDVVVFRNPQDNRQNYIKRLIGLPGETIEIVHGDIFVSANGPGGDFQVQRKPHRAQEAMWQVVYENDYRPNLKPGRSAPAPSVAPVWAPEKGQWDLTLDRGRTFQFGGGDGGEIVLGGGRPIGYLSEQDRTAQEQYRDLFLPHYGYNNPQNEGVGRELDVCTDLKLSASLVPQGEPFTAGLELTSFNYLFRAEVSSDGTCRLTTLEGKGQLPPRNGEEIKTSHVQQSKVAPLQSAKAYQVSLTHADLEATLWVDDKPVLRTSPAEYNVTYKEMKATVSKVQSGARVPAPEVRLAGQGGKFQMRHVQLMRDVYYTTRGLTRASSPVLGTIANLVGAEGSPGWGTTNNPITLRGQAGKESDLDEFYVLGDNSPLSLDSRFWADAAPTLLLWKDPNGPKDNEPGARENIQYQLGTVPRYCMIGKALFVYWPAGYRLIGGVPLVPDVGRMRLIR